MAKKRITYGELEEQLVSQKEAIDLVLDAIKGKAKTGKVSQDELEDYELMMDAYQPAKAEMTGRARVSC